MKKTVPYIVAAVIFLIVSTVYFFPVLEGEKLLGHDNISTLQMSHEIFEYNNTGDVALWTNSMFGGMPAYQISFSPKYNIVKYVHRVFEILGRPVVYLFMFCLFFYFILATFKVDRWLRIAGAIAFAFSSYNIIIIFAGHSTKAFAIAYMFAVIAGIIIAYRKDKVLGAIITAVFLALELRVNHVQITYYGLITVIVFGIFELYAAIKNKQLKSFVQSTLILIGSVVIAVGLNIVMLWTTYEYAKETIRGPSELTSGDETRTSGLDKDYVVQYSLGIDETMTLLIPDFMGGGSQINPGTDSESYRTLQQRTQNARQNIQAVSMYHGGQPPTSGPVYLGAIVIFLFVMGLFVVKGRDKWWLLTATILSVVLAWGKNFMWLTNLFLDYVPLYNKFRAPTIILVIAQFTVPLLGFIGLNKVLSGGVERKDFLKGLKWAAIITGGITLLFALLPGIAGDFTHPSDASRLPEWLLDSVIADRKAMLRSDAFRSFVFIVLAAAAVYAWHLKKIKTNIFIIVLGILILADLWFVDKRYLNKSHFQTRRQVENPIRESVADREILKDKDISYRVLPFKSDAFQDARASYFHKNVGGYHAAKLRRYQELIEHHIFPEMQEFADGFQNRNSIDSLFSALQVLNMLNTRYLILDVNQPPLRNPSALGNAWFVSDYKMVANADEEIAALNDFNPGAKAIIDQRFEELVTGKSFDKDSNGGIELAVYEPNYLKYNFKANTEQLVVFSEVYYDLGWKAFIDGREVPHFRVDYILRAMVVPAGEHIIEFKFEPRSYFLGNKISFASSVLLLLIIAGYVGVEARKKLWRKKS